MGILRSNYMSMDLKILIQINLTHIVHHWLLDFEPTYYVFSDPKSVKKQQNELLTRIEKWNNTKEWYLCTRMSEKSS
jgi:hypothetical protein